MRRKLEKSANLPKIKKKSANICKQWQKLKFSELSIARSFEWTNTIWLILNFLKMCQKGSILDVLWTIEQTTIFSTILPNKFFWNNSWCANLLKYKIKGHKFIPFHFSKRSHVKVLTFLNYFLTEQLQNRKMRSYESI